MKLFFSLSLFFFGSLPVVFTSLASASGGLVIHSEEFGVGKFHRADNAIHSYDPTSAWSPYVLPNSASINQPLTQKNADGSYTVFFSTLDDLVNSVIQISDSQNQKVSVLNVHGHGLPGAMWFPKDAATLSDWTCNDWVTAATGSDQQNYSQYYSAVSVQEIQQIRDMSNNPNIQTGCTTGLPEWTAAVAKTPHFKDVFESDAQVHFLSCVVGMGSVGQNFTQGIAALLLPNGSGRVETSMDFGLGDWSMPQGMGFWDEQSEAQVDHDNSLYVVDHKDSEIAQTGTVRMATYSGSAWSTSLLANRSFMSLEFEELVQGSPALEEAQVLNAQTGPAPLEIRVPGTAAHVIVFSK